MDQNPAPITNQSATFSPKKVVPFIVVGLVLLGGVVLAILNARDGGSPFLTDRLFPENTPTDTPEIVEEAYHPVIMANAELSTSETGAQNLDIYINHVEGIDNLTTFALALTVNKADSMPGLSSAQAVTPNPELTNNNWAFPINAIEEEGEGITIIKLAGIRVGSDEFPVTDKLLLASVPLEDTVLLEDLTLDIDSYVSEAFDKQGRRYTYELETNLN